MSDAPEQVQTLRSAVETALRHANALAAVGELYSKLAAEVDRRRPVCSVSGRCCRFEEYGHRMFVTTLELAKFVADIRGAAPSTPLPVLREWRGEGAFPCPPNAPSPLPSPGEGMSTSTPTWDGTGCPFQIDKLCGVHALRPLGCRMYFCDPTSTEWQNDLYERLHAELRRLHDETGVPYRYVEWRQALIELGLADVSAGKNDRLRVFRAM